MIRQVTTVYTIGYEGTDIDRFVATLKAVGVNLVADVRAVAISRKKGFSKTALRSRLALEGIGYQHFVALGDPKPGRDAARAGRHAEFARIYSSHIRGAEAMQALDLLGLVACDQVTCLLCFERDPKDCHRSIVAMKLQRQGLDCFNLYGDMPRRYDQFTKRPRRHFSESATAA